MKRYRIGLLAIGLGLVGGLLAGGGETVQAQPTPPAAPGASRTLSLATLAPSGSTWMRVLEAWNRELRRRSGQTLQFRFYPGGVQGDEGEVIRKIRAGRLDGAAVTAVGLSQIHRPALVFQMPGMFRTYAQLDTARNAETPSMVRAFEAAGFMHMGWADVGMSRLFSRVPVSSPAGMRALHPWRWRDDSVLPALFEESGATTVSLQVPEVLTALQTNRIDSLISTPVATVALQWSSRLTHMTEVNPTVTIGATVIGRPQFTSLSAEHQAMLRETAAQFHQLLVRNLRTDEQSAIRSMSNRGITIVTPTAPELEQWRGLFNRARLRLVGQIADATLVNRVRPAN